MLDLPRETWKKATKNAPNLVWVASKTPGAENMLKGPETSVEVHSWIETVQPKKLWQNMQKYEFLGGSFVNWKGERKKRMQIDTFAAHVLAGSVVNCEGAPKKRMQINTFFAHFLTKFWRVTYLTFRPPHPP